MSKFLNICTTVALSLSTIYATAQSTDPNVSGAEQQYANQNWKPSLVKDGVIDKVQHEYRVQPWKSIREIDIAYQHRVTKVIPVNEKQNAPFIYQGDEFSNGGAFIEILNHAIRTGQISAYNPLDDRFTTKLNLETFETQIGGGSDTIPIIDPETEEETIQIIKREFNINHVTRYYIKEDYIFDRNAGRMQKYIIGIAPILDVYDQASSTYKYSTTMYWIHYPSAREVLGKYEVYNSKNMLKRMTWANYLEGGYYSSFVEKYSKNNPKNSKIKADHREKNLRALVEGEKVIEDLMNQELDMWER